MSTAPFVLEPSRILITGAGGQIAEALRSYLADDTSFEIFACTKEQLDITRVEQIRTRIAKFEPHYIVNCAGFNHVDPSQLMPDQAFSVNRDGAGALAQICAHENIPLLHLSTDYVFDGHYASGYSEEDEAAPLGVYGQSKWQGEEAIREHLKQHIILRVSWLFSRQGDNFLQRTLTRARYAEQMTAANDRRGAPTSAQDVARVLKAILLQLANGATCWGTYHYCGAEITTKYGFMEAVVAAARQYEDLKVKELVPVSSDQLDEAAERPTSSVLKCTKILNAFGIRQRPWRTALQQLVRELYTDPQDETR